MKSIRLGLLAGLVLPHGLGHGQLCPAARAAGSPRPAADDGMHHHDHRGDPAQHRAHMAEHLRSVLQLDTLPRTAPSTPSWTPCTPGGDADHHGDMDHHDHDADQHLTTPARLDKMLAHFDQMRTRMVAKADAVKTFYAQLSLASATRLRQPRPMMMGRGGR